MSSIPEPTAFAGKNPSSEVLVAHLFTALAPLLQASPLPADFAADAPDARSHEPRDLVVVLTGRNVDRSRLERVLGMPPANAGGGAA